MKAFVLRRAFCGYATGIDLFGRIIDQRWQNDTGSTPADIDRYQYTYDQDSNRLTRTNTVNTALNETYTYDILNRLTVCANATLPQQEFFLDATGNWSTYAIGVAGSTLLQTRTSNTVNEITSIGATTGPLWTTPAYDAAGNTTSFPQPNNLTSAYTATYDAWNRMITVQAGSVNVASFVYDGRNRRITQKTYTSGTLSETREFYFTNRWQDIEEQVSGSMVDQYVYGVRYLDELICRDDSTPNRYYVAQDASFNVTSICDTSGTVEERYRYQPYGQQTVFNASWTVLAGSAYDWVVGFQGLQLDVGTGLIYLRRRWLHAQLGACVQRDLVRYGPNLYVLAGSNPIIWVDPYGRFRINNELEQIAKETIEHDLEEEALGWGPEDPFADVAAIGTTLYGVGLAVEDLWDIDWDFPTSTDTIPDPRPPCPCDCYWGPRMSSGNAVTDRHNAFATLISGRNEDYYCTTPGGVTKAFDGLLYGDTVFEAKTGHEWLASYPNFNSYLWTRYAALYFGLIFEQSVADECELNFVVFTDNRTAADAMNSLVVPIPVRNQVRFYYEDLYEDLM